LTTAETSPLPGGGQDTALARGCPSLPVPVTGAEVEPSLGSAFSSSVGTRIVYSEEQNTHNNKFTCNLDRTDSRKSAIATLPG